jgi:DNA integrity scanning protein DisA with diadenylate cyclase activity
MITTEIISKIKMVAPGTFLRRALDDILKARFGALIVLLDDMREQEKILEGGFYIGANFSPEKLYELAKMDGAIILDETVSRILAANVQLAPDPTIPTIEALKSMQPVDSLKIACLLGRNVSSEPDIHDIQVRPRGFRLLQNVAKIPPSTVKNVVDRFKDIVSLGQADAANLMEVEGIVEKRAKAIIEGIRFIRNKSIYS